MDKSLRVPAWRGNKSPRRREGGGGGRLARGPSLEGHIKGVNLGLHTVYNLQPDQSVSQSEHMGVPGCSDKRSLTVSSLPACLIRIN